MTEAEREEAERAMQEAREKLEVGQLWIQYPDLPPQHPNRMILEVRGFVDDQVVLRFWMKHKGYFGYKLESIYSAALNLGVAKPQWGATWFLAENQDWRAHGVDPEDDDVIG